MTVYYTGANYTLIQTIKPTQKVQQTLTKDSYEDTGKVTLYLRGIFKSFGLEKDLFRLSNTSDIRKCFYIQNFGYRPTKKTSI